MDIKIEEIETIKSIRVSFPKSLLGKLGETYTDRAIRMLKATLMNLKIDFTQIDSSYWNDRVHLKLTIPEKNLTNNFEAELIQKIESILKAYK